MGGASSLTVTVLGSSASTLTKARRNSSFLVEKAGKYLMVDTPPMVAKNLTDLGIPIQDLMGVIVTHDHVDHCLGLPALVHNFLFQEKVLPVYAPAQTIDTLQQLLSVLRLSKEGQLFRTDFYPLKQNVRIRPSGFCGVELRAHPTLHSRETMAVAIIDQGLGKKAVFTSDTGFCLTLADFAAEAELLVHDCSGLHKFQSFFGNYHSSSRQAGLIAFRARAKHLLLTHLNADYYPSEKALVQEGKEVFAGKISVAKEGQVYSL